ncbi:UNVERIFIED_ORG: hypothetical protein B2H93_04610 [Clostridium botulinum]
MLKELKGVTNLPTQYSKHKEIIEYLNSAIEDMEVIFQERDDKAINVVPKVLKSETSEKNILVCLQNSKSVSILIRSVKDNKNKSIVFRFTTIKEMKDKLLDVKVKTENEKIITVKKTVEQAIKDEYIRVLKGNEYQEESIINKPKIYFVEKNDENIEKLLEGKILEKYVKQKERNSKARKEKFKEAHNRYGKVFCEICGEDEECVLDVHHEETQVKDMEENHVTELEDLNILCANCHRRVHARKITVEELKNSIK